MIIKASGVKRYGIVNDWLNYFYASICLSIQWHSGLLTINYPPINYPLTNPVWFYDIVESEGLDMLNLAEEYFLLMLDSTGSANFWGAQKKINHGLVRAVLEELKLTGFIQVIDQQCFPLIKITHPGNPALEAAFRQLTQSEETKTIEEWSDLLRSKKYDLRKLISDGLTDRGILRINKKWYSSLITFMAYTIGQPSVVFWIKMRIRAIALFCEPPDERSMTLLYLLKETGQLYRVFDRYERSIARKITIPLRQVYP